MSEAPLLSATAPRTTWHPERYNQWTHAAGFLLSMLGGTAMLATVWQTHDQWRVVGCAMYVASLTALYAASTLSHSFDDRPRREFYRMLDQVCILLFIAASFSAFVLTHWRTPSGWGILATIWLVVLTGVWLRIRRPDETLPIALFVPLGWLPVIAIGRMYEVGHAPGLILVLAGGVAYTGGFWFLMNDARRPWFHAAWHLSTITGAVLHYFYLYEFVACVSAG